MNKTGDDAFAANVKLAKTCLGLIRDIAARGACSANPEHIGYALQEISQVLLERTGTKERRFEPVPAGQIGGLDALLAELDCVDCSSQDMAALEIHIGNGFAGYARTLMPLNPN
jgi:hypothetical protein